MYKHLQTIRVPRTMALMVLMLIASVLPCGVSARDFQYAYEGQTLTYTVIDSNAKTVKTKNGSYFFAGNKVSGELVIPSIVNDGQSDYTVVELGENSFSNIRDLTSVTIPSTVVTIGEGAFSYCWGLTSVTIPNSVSTIGESTFRNCAALTSVIIPNSVSTIGRYAFWGCEAMTNVTISNSLITIKEYTFCDCKSLTEVTIPNSVTAIKDYAFSNCSELKKVTIQEGDETITLSSNAFGQTPIETLIINRNWANEDSPSIPNCVKNVYLGNKITAIPNQAFDGCVNLTNITIPESVTSIGGGAFTSTNLNSIIIPGSVTTVGDYAFSNCSNLKKLIIEEGEGTIEFVYKPTDQSPISELVINRNWTTGRGYSTYSALSESVHSVTLGDKVTSLPDGAFASCKNLTFMTIPNSVTTIGKDAFLRSTKLMSVTIGEGVKEIGTDAFAHLTDLERLIALPTTPPTCMKDENPDANHSGQVFCNLPKAKVYIPEGTYQAYSTAEGWSFFSSFIEMGNITVTFNNSNVSVPEGQTYTLSAEITKPDDLEIYTYWYTSDASIASVDRDGVLTARKQGTATITLEVNDYLGRMFTASCEVTVTEASGVEDIVVDGSTAPAEYYNLNGVRVNSSTLTPGIYIKLQGGKAEKVLVK